MKNRLYKYILLFLMILFSLSKNQAQDSLLLVNNYHIGFYGGLDLGFYKANFPYFNQSNCQTCNKIYFGSKTGIGFDGGFLFSVPIQNNLSLELRPGFYTYSAEFTQSETVPFNINGNLQYGNINYNLKTYFSDVSFSALLNYRIIDNLNAKLGPRFSYLLSSKFDQIEEIAGGKITFDDGNTFRNKLVGQEIPDPSKLRYSISLGASYDLYLSSKKNLAISPEVYFDFGLNKLSSDDWTKHSAFVQIALKYNFNQPKETEKVIEKKDSIAPIKKDILTANPECKQNATYNPDTKKCECNPGYVDVNGSGNCVEIAKCGPNSVLNKATNECDCIAGFIKDANGNCIKEVKPCTDPNSVRNAQGDCECKSGFETINGKCVPVCQPGFARDANGNCIKEVKPCADPNSVRNAQGDCECKSGFETFNGKCVPVCQPGYARDANGNCIKEVKPCLDPNSVRNAQGDCECKSGFETINGKCVPVCQPGFVRDASGNCIKEVKPCSDPNSVRNAQGDCECKPNYINISGNCVPETKCGPNSTLNKTTNDCECNAGFVKINGDCVKEKPCGSNSKYNPATNDCDCLPGFEKFNDNCVPICKPNQIRDNASGKCIDQPCPDPNALRNAQGDCDCKPGFETVNGKCEPKCGPNTQRNSKGGCDCLPGYEMFNGNCVPVCAPNQTRDIKTGNCIDKNCGDPNAVLNAKGDCECKSGFETVNGKCLPICKPYQTRDAAGNCVDKPCDSPNMQRNADGDCECKPGFESVDGKCEPKCGPNMERNSKGECVPIPGYEIYNGQSVQKCGPFQIRDASGKCIDKPCDDPNSRPDGAGGCICLEGYDKDANDKCVKIDMNKLKQTPYIEPPKSFLDENIQFERANSIIMFLKKSFGNYYLATTFNKIQPSNQEMIDKSGVAIIKYEDDITNEKLINPTVFFIPEGNNPTSMDIDNMKNIYLAGSFDSKLEIGEPVYTLTTTNSPKKKEKKGPSSDPGRTDGFFIRFGQDLKFDYAFGFGSERASGDLIPTKIYSIAADKVDNVFAVGTCGKGFFYYELKPKDNNGVQTFNTPIDGYNNKNTSIDGNPFIMKISKDGSNVVPFLPLPEKKDPKTNIEYRSIVADPSGSSITFSGYSNSSFVLEKNQFDKKNKKSKFDFVVSANNTGSSGEIKWKKIIDGKNELEDGSMTSMVLSNGSLYLGGNYMYDVSIDGKTLYEFKPTIKMSKPVNNLYLIKVNNSDGTVQWNKRIEIAGKKVDSTSTINLIKVANDENGYPYVIGTFNNGIKFEGNDNVYYSENTKDLSKSVFIAKLNQTDGSLLWVKTAGLEKGDITAQDIAIDTKKSIIYVNVVPGDKDGNELKLKYEKEEKPIDVLINQPYILKLKYK
jgi:hypothetical protein